MLTGQIRVGIYDPRGEVSPLPPNLAHPDIVVITIQTGPGLSNSSIAGLDVLLCPLEILPECPKGLLVLPWGSPDDWAGADDHSVIDFCAVPSWSEFFYRIRRSLLQPVHTGIRLCLSWGVLWFQPDGFWVNGCFCPASWGCRAILETLAKVPGEFFSPRVLNRVLGLGPGSRLSGLYVSQIRCFIDSVPGLRGRDVVISVRGKGYCLCP